MRRGRIGIDFRHVAGRQRVEDGTSQDKGGHREDLSLVPLPLTACAFLVPLQSECTIDNLRPFSEDATYPLPCIFVFRGTCKKNAT